MRAKERALAIEAIGKDAAQHAAAHEFDKALRALDRGLENWRDDSSLDSSTGGDTRGKTLLGAAGRTGGDCTRELSALSAIAKRGQEARARADAGDFDGALALLDGGLKNWPDASSLHRLRESTLPNGNAATKRQRALQELEEIRLLALQESGASETAELLSMAVSSRRGVSSR